MMAATVLFVTSCGEDVENPILTDDATITGFQVDGADADSLVAEPGEEVQISVAYDLGEETEVTLNAFIGDSAVIGAQPLTATSTNPTQTFVTVPEDAEDDITIEYQLQDADGTVIASEDFTITVDRPMPAEVYSAVLLEAPLGDRTSETFFSATNGETYTLQEVIDETGGVTSDSIHFGYYYLGNTGAVIASPVEYNNDIYNLGPNGANWGTLNDTKFRQLENFSEQAFNDITSSDVVAAQFETPSAESGAITQLAVGQVYAFSFSDGDETRYGIFRVAGLVAGLESTGSITLTVKVAAENS